MKWFFCCAFFSLLSAGCSRADAPVASNRAAQSEPVTGTFEVPPPRVAPAPGVLRLPAPPLRRLVGDAQITFIKNKLSRYPTSAGYRRLAVRSIELGLFPEAALAYRAEAATYRKRGLNDAALIIEKKAALYDTQIEIFEQRAPTAREMQKLDTNAPLEPKIGAYLGAFIDRDDRLARVLRGTNYQSHRYPQDFARLVGKPHATYFTYVAYGQPIPREWLEMCKREKVIPHIAWEPKSLKAVKDDKYLQNWAKALGALNWPVFIRFAGEMNGFWTPYNKDPVLYRAKFRLVHQVLHRYAPRVATIWCVNSVPAQNIADYYPGDDGCDWVGVNLYSAPFYDNDARRPALSDNPLSLLDPVYKRYASRKPIAICEYGASHMAAVDRKLRNRFAIEKMTFLYSALPLLYPRVKMINWFDSDNLKYARAGRQLNNYSLTEQAPILAAYQKLVATPFFLGEIPDEVLKPSSKTAARIPLAYFPLRANQVLAAPSQLSIWVKTFVARPKVFLALGGKVVYAGQGTGVHSLILPPLVKSLEREDEVEIQGLNGKIQAAGTEQKTVLTAYIYDEHNRFIHSMQVAVLLNTIVLNISSDTQR